MAYHINTTFTSPADLPFLQRLAQRFCAVSAATINVVYVHGVLILT